MDYRHKVCTTRRAISVLRKARKWQWKDKKKRETLNLTSQSYITKASSSSDIVYCLKFLANTTYGNTIRVVHLPCDSWNHECNKMLLRLLIRKNKIFSLNMADNEVGPTTSNVVAQMVELLEQKVHLTSLCLSYFGNNTNKNKYGNVYSLIQKNMQDKLAMQKQADPGKAKFPITDEKVINKMNRSKSNCTYYKLYGQPHQRRRCTDILNGRYVMQYKNGKWKYRNQVYVQDITGAFGWRFKYTTRLIK
jgi:hypothetical protein